jgi:hypothetical protein
MRRQIVVLAMSCVLIGAIEQAGAPFSIVLLPDTQFYSLRDPATYRDQTQFIVDSQSKLNIRAAVHLGDVTDKNTIWEWFRASAAHKTLDEAGIPYSVTTGNHDHASVPDQDRRRRDPTLFNATFPASRFEGKRFQGETWYGGHFGSGTATNYILFKGGGLDFMVMSLEYAPPKDAMCWASNVLKANATKRAIVSTHCYQNWNGKYVGSCDTDEDRNMVGANGQAIWNELVRQHKNVFLVLSGHINGSDHQIRSRETGLAATAATVDSVHEILTDYQGQIGLNPTRVVLAEHGNGWLRILEFAPSSDRVSVRTKSVLRATSFNAFATFGEKRFSASPNASDHKFAFNYRLTGPAFIGGPPDGAVNPIPATAMRFSDRTVNAVSDGNQVSPQVAIDAAGNWVGVWADDRNNNDVYQIRARGFTATGCQRFGEITVNTDSKGQQLAPALAAAADGRFVVAWHDDGGDGKYQIKMRGFNSDGSERFSQRTVNNVASGQQLEPAIAMASNGDFIVGWQDDAGNDGKYQIVARLFNADGTPKAGQFTVNSNAAGQQLFPSVAASLDGDFVVAWQDDTDGNGTYQIKGRGFKKDGSERFAQRTVNETSKGQQRKPVVAMAPNGSFVAAWEDDGGDSKYQIVSRRFRQNGTAIAGNQTVNVGAAGNQLRPTIAMRAYDGNAGNRGEYVISWEDDFNNNQEYQIKARGFNANGTQLMSQVTVNRNSRGQQLRPAVTLGPDGRFVVAWQDDLEKNGVWEILARGCTLSAKCEW